MTWSLGDQMRQRLGKGVGIGLVPSPDKQEEQATTPSSASPEGGFSGGVQGASGPEGESFADEVRRRAGV
jgi:hypothetical protein